MTQSDQNLTFKDQLNGLIAQAERMMIREKPCKWLGEKAFDLGVLAGRHMQELDEGLVAMVRCKWCAQGLPRWKDMAGWWRHAIRSPSQNMPWTFHECEMQGEDQVAATPEASMPASRVLNLIKHLAEYGQQTTDASPEEFLRLIGQLAGGQRHADSK